MKRPLFAIGVSYFITTWLAFLCDEASVMYLSVAALVTAALFFLLRSKWRFAHAACVIFLTVALAFAVFWLYLGRQVIPVRELAGKTVTVEGLITDIERGPSSTAYTMKVDFTDYPELPGQMPLLIRSIGELEQSAGDTIRCRVRLMPAPESIWYKSRGLLLTGQNARYAQNIPAGRYRIERAMLRLRDILARNVYANLSGDSADVVSAMVLGMKNNVSPEIYSAVGRSGTSHLLSISGLHLSILSAFLLAFLKKLRVPGALGSAVTIILCFLFVALVGLGASVFRSFVMTAIALSGRMFSRRGDSLSSLGLALLVCGVIWPHWALGWGLWLSAGSTLGIILLGDKITAAMMKGFKHGTAVGRMVKYVMSGLGISLAAYVFTLPVLLLMSGWISLISPLANILVAPFVPVVILGGIVSAIFTGTSWPVQAIAAATDFATAAVIRISEILGKLPFAIAAIDESYLLLWLAGLCVFAVILFVYRGDKRLIGYGLALLLFSYSAGSLSLYMANKNRVELVTLEGHDTALLLRGGEAVILGTPDAYEISNLLRYLNFRGVRGIPAVIASDSGDRVGSGLLRLAGAYSVDCVIGPNDAYIVSQLEAALPKSLVYAGGYAEITVLGGAKITTDLQRDDIYIQIGKNQIVKIFERCDIIEADEHRILVYDDGVLLLPKRIPPLFEPVGAHLFGESRVTLSLGG